jgi:SAM-dependent methyltransferase
MGRVAASGAWPNCLNCGSLERHRIIRRIFQALPNCFLDWRRGIQFSRDPGIEQRWFSAFELSIYGHDNSIDTQDIQRANASFDFIALNHVLESVPDDRKAFRELCRVLSHRGFMLISFGGMMGRDVTVDLPEPLYDWKAYRLYGQDVLSRLRCRQAGMTVLVVEETDPCTGVREPVHLFFRDPEDALQTSAWISTWSNTARILHGAEYAC